MDTQLVTFFQGLRTPHTYEILLSRSSQDAELRRRTAAARPPPPGCTEQGDNSGAGAHQTPGVDQHQWEERMGEEERKEEFLEAVEPPEESSTVPGSWSPLLTNVCLYTALAVSAYVCYRAYFH